MMKKTIDVCLSPELLHLFDVKNAIVVVVDILRATSCMTTAFEQGVKTLIPVSTLEECEALRAKGFLTAAERNGQKVDGFDFGNSPYSYLENEVKGKSVGVTTTNGTLAINKSKEAIQVIIGSFLNKTAINNYLKEQNQEVIILCAGWKGKANLEDTLYAGAIIEGLQNDFDVKADSAVISQVLYEKAKNNLFDFLKDCNHVKRLSKQEGIMRDIEFCLQEDIYRAIPILKGEELVLA